MKETTFRDAKRSQESLLAPLEKKCLIWMAHRLPARVNSDHLTLLGFTGMILVGAAYAWASRFPPALFIASFFLVVNWFGDSLDGTLARVRNRLRPRYGFYVDHVADAFGTFFLVGGMAISGYMTPVMGLGILIAYFLLNIEVYLATYSLGTFNLSHFKLSPTELRLLLMAGNTVAYFKPVVHVAGYPFLLFDAGAAFGMAGMGIMVVLAAIRHTRELYRQEKLD